MIKLHEVQKIYTTLGGGQHVLKDINLFFEKGQFVAVLGKSGCGKTTLLNLIAGLDTPSSGQISIDGKLMSKMKDDELDEFRNHRIGIIFQNYNLINHLNVLENVMLSLDIAGKTENKKEKALDILKRVGLEDHTHKLVTQLSGGQKQRVAIARALVTNPDIILADEPTGALDSKTSIEVMDLIKEVCKDKLVIFVTHNKNLAKTYANRIIEMKDGRVVNDDQSIDERVKVDLNKKLVTNKLSFKSSIKYAFKSAFKFKGRTILIALGLALGITIISLIDGVFNGARSKITDNYLLENNLIVYTNSDTVSNDKIKEIDGVTDVFDVVNSCEVIKLGTKDISNVVFPRTLQIPTQTELKNEFIEGIQYGSFPNNDNEIAISYDVFNSFVNTSGDEEKMADTILNKTMTVVLKEELVVTSDEIAKFEQMADDYQNDPVNNEKCIRFEFRKVDGFYNYYIKGTDELLFESEHTDLIDMARQFYLEYDSHFGDVQNNTYYLVDTSNINYDNVSTSRTTKDVVISGIFKSEINNISMSNFLKDEPLDGIFKTKFIYIDYNKVSEKTTIIKNIEDLTGLKVYDYQYHGVSSSTSKFVLNLLQFVFTAISSVTLVTGAIMLWILLHVNVSQRKREIGMLRSMGATKNDVKNIFVSETLVIGVLSCIISLALILIITIFANIFIPNCAYTWFVTKFPMLNGNKPVIINVGKLFIIFGVGIVVSVFAGYIPSSRACGKKPIDSLRGE